MANEITSACWEEAITLPHRVITLYKWRSAGPAVCPPRAMHTWPGQGSCREPLVGNWLISRRGLHGGQSWVAAGTQACLGLGAKSQEHPTMPRPTQLSAGVAGGESGGTEGGLGVFEGSPPFMEGA